MTATQEFFYWLEHTPVSLWVRGGSLLVFPAILTVHTVGMGFLVGINAAIALRIWGVAGSVPLAPLAKAYPVLWAAFATNAISGVLLFIAYPYKAFSNPLFIVKLSLIAFGIFLMLRIRNEVLLSTAPSTRAKTLAALSIASWAGTILAGRLLAYTYTWLLVGIRGGF